MCTRGAKNVITLKHPEGCLAAALAVALMHYGISTKAQSASNACKPSKVIPLTIPEPAAKLLIDAPLSVRFLSMVCRQI